MFANSTIYESGFSWNPFSVGWSAPIKMKMAKWRASVRALTYTTTGGALNELVHLNLKLIMYRSWQTDWQQAGVRVATVCTAPKFLRFVRFSPFVLRERERRTVVGLRGVRWCLGGSVGNVWTTNWNKVCAEMKKPAEHYLSSTTSRFAILLLPPQTHTHTQPPTDRYRSYGWLARANNLAVGFLSRLACISNANANDWNIRLARTPQPQS